MGRSAFDGREPRTSTLRTISRLSLGSTTNELQTVRGRQEDVSLVVVDLGAAEAFLECHSVACIGENDYRALVRDIEE